MAIGYTCARCGEKYSKDVVEQWGRTKETSGYGPQPKCVELVDRPGTPEGTLEVCGGQLVAGDIGRSSTKDLHPIG